MESLYLSLKKQQKQNPLDEPQPQPQPLSALFPPVGWETGWDVDAGGQADADSAERGGGRPIQGSSDPGRDWGMEVLRSR